MSLVNYPMTNRGQNPALGRDIAEQQGMVGDHHIGMCRATAGAVDQAFIGKKRAEATNALARGRRKVGAVDAAPPNADRVEVTIG